MKIWEAEERRGWETIRMENMLTSKKKENNLTMWEENSMK